MWCCSERLCSAGYLGMHLVNAVCNATKSNNTAEQGLTESTESWAAPYQGPGAEETLPLLLCNALHYVLGNS